MVRGQTHADEVKRWTRDDRTWSRTRCGSRAKFSDRVCFIDKGRIREQASPEEFFSAPKNTRTQEFLQSIIDPA